MSKNLPKIVVLSLLTLAALTVPALAQAETTKLINPLEGIGIHSLLDLFTFLIKWAILLAGIAATISIIIAGYELIWNSGEKDPLTKAKNRLVWSVAGLAVILLSYTIVTVVVNTLSGKRSNVQIERPEGSGGESKKPSTTTPATPSPEEPITSPIIPPVDPSLPGAPEEF